MPYKDNPSNYTRCEKCKHIDRENEKCKITNDNWLVPDRAGTCHQFEGVENMKVRCIDDKPFKKFKEKLELNKEYEVLEIDYMDGEKYFFVDVNGSKIGNNSKYFEVIEDEKEVKKLVKEFEEQIEKVGELASKSSASAEDYISNFRETVKNYYNNVNHPSHYNKGKFEVIDVIEDWNLGFNLGNTVKYIARCEYKENKIQDLEKAMWYLKRELEKLEKGE